MVYNTHKPNGTVFCIRQGYLHFSDVTYLLKERDKSEAAGASYQVQPKDNPWKWQEVYLRNGVASNGNIVFEILNTTYAETDYLLSYPNENSYNPEEEGQFLE